MRGRCGGRCKLLELGGDALTAARVALWLRDNPAPGIYVRQLGLPGVHTKFIENHRKVIDRAARRSCTPAPMLLTLTPKPEVPREAAVGSGGGAGVASGRGRGRTPAARFAARHGFLHPPELVRFRALDPEMPLLGERAGHHRHG